MMRRMVKFFLGRTGRITAGLLLMLACLAVLHAVPASAASSVESWWGSATSPQTLPCNLVSTTVRQGAVPAVEVYNPCGDRVWVHYVSVGTGEVQAYCVNPGGGLAYKIPLQWSSTVTYSDIQLSNNTSPCDDASKNLGIRWWQANSTFNHQTVDESCHIGTVFTKKGFYISGASNSCDFRVWLHQFDNGTGNTKCLNPGNGYDVPPPSAYWQAQMSANQAPCNAGPPPFKP